MPARYFRTRAMPSLHELQSAVRRSLLGQAGGDAADFIVGAGLTADDRLGIYRNTMVGTFSNALRLTFPAVQRLVGADFFDHAAQIFACKRPPRCANLDAFGDEFPDFLACFEPAATLPYLSDVARLEWAVTRALHADDSVALDLTQLAGVATCDHDRICFVSHPSITVLRSAHPVDAIWRAVLEQDDAMLARIDADGGPVFLLVQRLSDQVEVLRLDHVAWDFSAMLLSGHRLGTAIDSAQAADAPALLAQHLAAGRCIGFRLAESSLEGITS